MHFDEHCILSSGPAPGYDCDEPSAEIVVARAVGFGIGALLALLFKSDGEP